MQIYKPNFYSKIEAKELVKHFTPILQDQKFGSEYYSKISKLEIEQYEDKYRVIVLAHDKNYRMELETCLKSLSLETAAQFLKSGGKN